MQNSGVYQGIERKSEKIWWYHNKEFAKIKARKVYGKIPV